MPGPQSRHAYVPYQVGEMVLFKGDHWHCTGNIAPHGDGWRRIMLTGHGVQVNGTWEIYY